MRGRISCRTASTWLAEADLGRLDAACRIRLQEHVESCRTCREQGTGISRIAELIREQATDFRRQRMNLCWRHIEGQLSPGPRLVEVPSVTARRTMSLSEALSRRPATAAMATAFGVVLGFLVVAKVSRSPRPDPIRLAAVVPSPAPETTDKATAGRQKPARWRLFGASDVTVDGEPTAAGAMIRAGESLRVGPRGRALLASRHEVVVLESATEATFTVSVDARRLELTRGRVSVGTRDDNGNVPRATRHELTVAVSGVIVEPKGTSFSVGTEPNGSPRVQVSEGLVHVRPPAGKSVALRSGISLRWGKQPTRFEAQARQRLTQTLRSVRLLAHGLERGKTGRVRLSADAGGQLRIDGLPIGAGKATLFLPRGHYLAESGPPGELGKPGTLGKLVEVATAERHVALAGSKAVSKRPVAPTERRKAAPTKRRKGWGRKRRTRVAESTRSTSKRLLRRIERHLAAGDPARARKLARSYLRKSGAPAAALQTLVAESYVREHAYRLAASVYLRIHRRFTASNYGAQALYMAGSLELDQVRRPRRAKAHFSRYLALYATGRLRQGAYIMLIRALRASGMSREARRVARRYIREYPKGRYRARIEST